MPQALDPERPYELWVDGELVAQTADPLELAEHYEDAGSDPDVQHREARRHGQPYTPGPSRLIRRFPLSPSDSEAPT